MTQYRAQDRQRLPALQTPEEVQHYLGQAGRLDQNIDSRLSVLASLNDLAGKCTSTLNGMPHGTGGRPSSLESTVARIVDLQEEINRDIDALVDLKADILQLIATVQDSTGQIVLEKRYLCYEDWKTIAEEMGYKKRTIYAIHERTLKQLCSTACRTGDGASAESA